MRRSCSAVLLCALLATAQVPDLAKQPADGAPQVPRVTFAVDWPEGTPPYYELKLDSTGTAAYESSEGGGAAGDRYRYTFVMSEAARARVFELARQAKYFRGDFEFRKHRVAFTGTKTLAYADRERQFQTTYNWSENPAVRDLTAMFQGMALSMEFGRRLSFARRYDRLGLDRELKRMEDLAKSNLLYELQAIAPLLQELARDRNVMNIAQRRARHLLAIAQGQSGAAASSR